jgi:hypothetical protein
MISVLLLIKFLTNFAARSHFSVSIDNSRVDLYGINGLTTASTTTVRDDEDSFGEWRYRDGSMQLVVAYFMLMKGKGKPVVNYEVVVILKLIQ